MADYIYLKSTLGARKRRNPGPDKKKMRAGTRIKKRGGGQRNKGNLNDKNE